MKEKRKRSPDRKRSLDFSLEPERSRPSEGNAERGRTGSNDDYKRSSRRRPSQERYRRKNRHRMERSISPRHPSPVRSSFQRKFRSKSKSPNVDRHSRTSERLYEQEKSRLTDRIETPYSSSCSYNGMIGLTASPPIVTNASLLMDHNLPQTFDVSLEDMSLQDFTTYGESEPPKPQSRWDRKEKILHGHEPIVKSSYNNHRGEFESNPSHESIVKSSYNNHRGEFESTPSHESIVKSSYNNHRGDFESTSSLEPIVKSSYNNHRGEFESTPKGNCEVPRQSREIDSDVPNALMFLSEDENHPDIPVFDGKNPDLISRQWTKIIDDTGNKKKWNSEKKKLQMASKLSGEPKEWFIRENKLTSSWNQLKQDLTKAFVGDMDYAVCLRQMMDRFKFDNETYGKYFTYKTMLLNSCNITGRKAVSCLINGLRDEKLKSECLDLNFATSELLYSFLTQHKPLPNQTASSPPDKSTITTTHKQLPVQTSPTPPEVAPRRKVNVWIGGKRKRMDSEKALQRGFIKSKSAHEVHKIYDITSW